LASRRTLAVDRAFAAIGIVHDKMRQMQASGGMKQLNCAFQAARRDAVVPLQRPPRRVQAETRPGDAAEMV
jgi:hypothetical protein